MRQEQPSRPVHALTSDEPRRHRGALEHSLNTIPAGVQVRDLHARLSEV
jgi:hypothetical protein